MKGGGGIIQCIFCLQVDGLIGGWGLISDGETYKWASLYSV